MATGFKISTGHNNDKARIIGFKTHSTSRRAAVRKAAYIVVFIGFVALFVTVFIQFQVRKTRSGVTTSEAEKKEDQIFTMQAEEAIKVTSNGLQYQDRHEKVRIAFIGNSILYFNDQPRFIEMLGNGTLQQDSCLRGGATLPSILKTGNGMSTKFHTDNAKIIDEDTGEVLGYDIGAPTVYTLLRGFEDNSSTARIPELDYVVMNDYTQAPTRKNSRSETIASLVDDYAPILKSAKATPVFLMTWAYHVEGVNNSADLGNTSQFTQLLQEGYEYYAEALGASLPSHQKPRIAPVGLAFYRVYKENKRLWDKLFHYDEFHPSPHGSFLAGCVLYSTIMGEAPKLELAIPSQKEGGPAVLWQRSRARLMQPPEEEPLERPTVDEAIYLYEVALDVTQAYKFSHYGNNNSRS